MSSSFSRQSPLMKVVVLVIAAAVAGVWWYNSRGNTTEAAKKDPSNVVTAEVGDCLQNKGSDGDPDMQKADCDGKTAEFKVASKFEAECKPGQSHYEVTRRGRTQYEMCLTPIEK
ncbi:LppU/SCO3897 family protein [Actinomycetota bacterium Odt1-20B]